MPVIVGIDLGTTHSLVAIMEPEGPRLIPNELGQMLTPSVVGRDDAGTILVGGLAKELQVTRPERCASVFKRQMGEAKWTADLGGKKLTAIELSSCVLRSLKRDAEAYLGHDVTDAVITVPAYFNEEQRRATIMAGKLAGLNVARILNEPTAAAIAYGLTHQDQDRMALVVDLGGGTFDVSIVELFDGTIEIRASAGEIFLGGEDFTNALASVVLQQQGLQFERIEMSQPLRISRLRRECEGAKRKLTAESHAEIRLPDQAGEFSDPPAVVQISREQFEQATARLLDQLTGPIRQALGDARLNRSQIQDVILVGGATRMPCVRKRIEDLLQQSPRFSLNPDEVVALGAAVHAAVVGRNEHVTDLVVTDVAPFTLGVEISNEVAGQIRSGYFLPVINRNTTIPVSRVKQVSTLQAFQTSVKVRVYQGESRKVAENTLLGEFEVTGIPRGPAGQAIDIRFTYDINGVLEAEATIVETKKKATHVFQRKSGNLSQKQLAEAVERMQALKMHPREETANRYLLQRAERLYAELPIRERDALDQLLRAFEDVLDLNDKEGIESLREMLQGFLAQFDDQGENNDGSGYGQNDAV
ncbi:Hsp70 family protein [Planctomicrobium piriforme]|uniref:Molecular chaperone HscC n=1 Tax=Planctomicrobium piriforme TaxID=1576369 RepID=A0A1I3HWQ0_9PLAN|nr:Hsp70 family protein [Planctomicrobium piriforme]SFI40017.1 molecular chaperone HscC [Planctomicrobium piriforme]